MKIMLSDAASQEFVFGLGFGFVFNSSDKKQNIRSDHSQKVSL